MSYAKGDYRHLNPNVKRLNMSKMPGFLDPTNIKGLGLKVLNLTEDNSEGSEHLSSCHTLMKTQLL